MGKPPRGGLQQIFMDRFYRTNASRRGKKQYLVPYLMSRPIPGCTLERGCVSWRNILIAERIRPEQVQDFYRTPGTVSTCMFYTGYHPLTMEKVYVPKSSEEKAISGHCSSILMPKNKPLVSGVAKPNVWI